MAYPATPKTWVAGDVLTAAQMNAELRDALLGAFPLGVGAWTSYTPTLTQSGAVTKTVTVARYIRIGNTIIGTVRLDVTGTGTAANAVIIGAPVTAQGSSNQVVGVMMLNDVSAGLFHTGTARLRSTTTFDAFPHSTDSGNVLGTAVFTAALAAGDVIYVTFMYEAA